MDSNEKTHIVSYKTYIFILIGLLILTFLSIEVTSIQLGPITVVAALLFACIKTSLVLSYFMHIKFDSMFFKIMVPLVFLLLGVLIIITYLDYIYR
jgi:cytochrome c oxidase subunit IV